MSGAVAILIDGEVAEAFDAPTFTLLRNGKQRRFLDEAAFFGLLKVHADAALALIEDVHAMPKQGVSSSFSFGFVTGQMGMALTAAGIPKDKISPQYWKKYLRVPAEKDGARAAASRLMPRAAHMWPLKKHDGRAEAALLAYFAWEKINGRISSSI